MFSRIICNILRKLISNIITEQRLRRTESEKDDFPPPHKGNADIDKINNKPFRHPAVKSSRSKKAEREEHEDQHRNHRCSLIDAFRTVLCDTELHYRRHKDKARRQHNKVEDAPPHRQRKCRRYHAASRRYPIQAFPQTSFMVKDGIKPFFNHSMSPPLKMQSSL